MTALIHDLRYGLRTLRRAPGFTVVAVLTLALGIGANTAMFGIVDALLFRPPSGVSDADRVARLQIQLPLVPGEPAEMSGVLPYPDFRSVRERVRALSAVAAYARSRVTVGETEDAQSEEAILVSGDYFRLLGTRPAVGRLLGPADDAESAPINSAVVSWDYWRRMLSGDPAIVGTTITLNNQPFTLVGIAPEHFVGTELGQPSFWLPLGVAPLLGYDARMIRSRAAAWLSVIGRLAPGVTREQAQAAVQSALLAARDEGADDPPLEGLGGTPGSEVRVRIGGPNAGPAVPATAPPPRQARLVKVGGQGDAGLPTPFARGRSLPVSLWFMGVTAAVLLIACANVANLLVARATNRRHEIAVRLSLGATRWRLTRQLMAENLMLAVMGGAAGLLVAIGGLALLPRALPLPPLPPLLDGRVLLFTTLLTLATTLAFGLLPALRAARADLQTIMNAAGRMRAVHSRGRSALVITQLAASLVLLVGAGLFLRSLRNVKAIDSGFAADRLLFATMDLRSARMSREQAEEFWRLALERVRGIPGVRSAALAATVPFQMNMMMPVAAPGSQAREERPFPAQADFAGVDYFSTLGIDIRQGRAFSAEDHATAAPVAIVNEVLARRLWPGESPLGKCLRAGGMGPSAPCAEVVGVAESARYADITADPAPFFYRPLLQRPRMGPPMFVLHVRAAGAPASLAGILRRELQGLDASVPFVNVRQLEELIRPQTLPWRIGTLLFSFFGGLGVVLAAIGLYGVLAFLVAQRTRELGVRIALGAQRRDVLALVLAQGGRLIAVGIVVGAAGAAAATRFFSSMMYGVSALDPLVYVATALMLAAVGLLAMYVPARRAVSVDPMVALRAD